MLAAGEPVGVKEMLALEDSEGGGAPPLTDAPKPMSVGVRVPVGDAVGLLVVDKD
jgi:hypothetical protein